MDEAELLSAELLSLVQFLSHEERLQLCKLILATPLALRMADARRHVSAQGGCEKGVRA